MKKGFTLIELLGVVVILGIIALITIPIVQNEIVKNSKKECQRQVKSFERAAKNYVASNPYKDYSGEEIISLDSLKTKGFLENKSLIIPGTEEKFTGGVTITYNSSNSTFSYEYNSNPCDIVYEQGSNTHKKTETDEDGNETTTIVSRTVTAPTFVEKTPGEVTINFPEGCARTNDLTCKYKIDSGEEIVVSSKTTTISLGESHNIVATAAKGSIVATSTYRFSKNQLYVSSSGNDETGYGTIAAPYATIAKAYEKADTYPDNKIYMMSDLNQTNTIVMDASKKITLISSDSSGKTGDSIINTLSKTTALGANVIDEKNGSLTFSNIILDGKNVSDTASALRINSGLTLNKGTTIKNFVSTSGLGGAIHTDDKKININMNGAAIINNSSPTGGGIHTGPSTTITIDNGTITGNKATDGAGIHTYGTLIINSAVIEDNIANNSGGGIYARAGSSTTIFGGTISNNEAINVHGGAIVTDGALTIKGGTISNNKCGNAGGMVYSNNSTINITGGTFKNNYAKYNGGGLFMGANVTLNVTGGTFSGNNTPGSGGAISCWENTTTCNITGGSITNNSSTSGHGGGVHNNGRLVIGGNVKIDGNTSTMVKTNNIFNQATVKDEKANFEFNDSNYKLTSSLNNSFVLDVAGGNIQNGQNVQLWQWLGGANQKWKFKPAKVVGGTVYYFIESQYNGTQYLWVGGNSMAEGANICTWEQHINTGGYWHLTNEGSGYYYIKNINRDMCVDTSGGYAENGKNIATWYCNNTNKWKPERV